MNIRHLSICLAVLMACTGTALAQGLAELMPEHVGDLRRVELLTGQQAQDAVDKLHGKPLPAEASVVARYDGDGENGRPAEVWVSRVSSEKEARRQTGQMVHLMFENPHSPFKNPKRLTVNEVAVYRFEGMGKAHLIWFSQDLVYWVSVSPENEAVFAEEFCR